MKVAFDSTVFSLQEYGGISRYFVQLLREFVARPGVDARVFAPLHINHYLNELDKAQAFGCQVPKIPKTGMLLKAFSSLAARPAIKRFRPQIVHHTYYSRSAYAPHGARRVVTVYDMIHERYANQFPKRDVTPRDKYHAVRTADHVICISESTRRDLLATFDLPPSKVTVIYLGAEGLQLSSERGRLHQKPYLLYVGQRGGYKNFKGLLRAYACDGRLRKDFDLLCFGGGAFTKDETELFGRLGLADANVVYVSGDDKRLAWAYRDAAVFVYPSLYEGFGIPPLEAMSVNCPVACSDTSSVPEVVGAAAEYFQPEDIDSIRQAIESVVGSASRRVELQARGAERCKQFSWRRCADETISIYKGLL